MAATKWHIGLDGCLTIEEPATGVTYHSSLNTIIVSTKTHALKVYDVTSGSLLQKSNLSASKSNTIRCFYLGEKDQMVFCDETSVGVRKDLNGVLLLDTALQTAVSRTEDIVKVELPLAEASQLFKSLVAAELPGIDYVEDVLKELEKRIEAVQEATKSNHKIAKWAAVCLQLPNCALKTVCNNLVLEMKRLNHHSPGLSIAAAISDRLSYLLPSSLPDVTNGPVERSLMYSEAARRETFGKWPHMNYKWALPDPMAQAGFYHQPNSAGDDRAMCFTCNVCLVCWEPTDEPWSEHERHSPSCPFVKGEYTQNVPLTVTYATQPAQLHGEPTDKIECISTTTSKNFFATSTLNGNIAVWNNTRLLKKNCQFNLDPSEMVITTKTGLQFEMDTTSQEQSNSESKPDSLPWQNEAGSKKDLMHELVPENSNSDFMTAKTPDIQDIPLDDEQLNKDLKAWKRTRPSQDVTVYSLCVVEKPECVLTSQKQGSQPVVQKPASQPTLLCGVSLRKTLPSCKVLNKLHHMNHNVKADVQLMNKVNEVVSNDSHPKIISDHVDSNDVDVLDRLVFIPFIIVVALQQEKAQKIKINNSNPKPSTSGNEMSVPTLGSIAMTHDWGVLDPMFESVADPEIQLASITGIGTKSTIQNNGNVVDFKISESSSSLSEVGEALSKSQSVDSLLKRTKPTPPNGHVLQCVELAKNLQVESLKISSITPILDGHFLVVILSPTSICDILKSTSEDDKRPGIPAANESAVQSSLDDSMPEGGSILVYKLSFENEHARVEEKVVVSVSVPLITESVMSVTALPTEFLGYKDEEEELCAVNNNRQQRAAELHGQIATTLYNGHIKVWNLADLTVVAEIIPEDGDYFTSLTCCTGLDRLCACTMSGKLHFYQLSEQNPEAMDVTNTGPPGDTSMDHDTLDGISTEDGMDQRNKLITGEESLFSEPLTTEKLLLLHSLTEFENLMPRYTATVPPCWTEIQQEQQQRRHPQHLQQQGEATQHTRTWKLQPDSNTWDEHLFEMVLPRPCSVGHIDVKFTLLNMCTSLPNIEVTLLKQNISNIGKQSVNAGAPGTQEKSASTPVDQKLDFNLHKKKVFPDTLDFSLLKQEENNVLDPLFLETHNAEILCGPISIASCLDLSGNNGLVSMTSPQLLNSKSKSFLLHIKGFPSKFDDSHEKPQPQELKKKSTVSAAATNSSSVSDKQKVKSIKSLFDNLPYSGMGAADRILATPKLKPENIQGCDWIQEISVTVRKTKKTSVPKERWHRNVMIESTDFHEKLLSAVTDLNESSTTTSRDHHQNLSLDILCWITAVQMTDPTHRTNERSIVSTIQKNLHKFVKVCFMQSTRTTAHKGARLLALCMEYCKISPDPDIAPSFSYNLLQSLLNCLPLLVSSYSAGALRWFFTLLSRVKCMDAHAVAEKCIYLLTTVAKTYHERETHHHSLLKSRYGLQGHPFDPDLFDLYPAQSLRQTGSSLTYASVVTNSSIGTAILAQQDEMDFYDLFNHLSEKNSEKFPSEYLRHNILGLLEVEPLHFTCHATSDGTKMERLDSGPTGNIPIVGTSGLSGTINFGESLSNAAVTGAAMAALPSSLAMAEQQVQQLASKVQQSKKDVESIKQLLSTVLKTVKPATTNSAEYGFKAPANPKTTPLFMTPPLTPPNENWSQAVTPYLSAALPNESGPLYVKVPSSVTGEKGQSSSSEKSDNKQKMSMVLPQAYHLLQPPSPQVLVVERMHSGARRFVILDFGKPILLTDVIIPACGDLASLSIDVWVQSEEVDGQRLVVASDIGVRSLIMNNIMSPPICRYLKLTTIGRYGGSTTRSKIPVGSFYGHNFIFPWEWNHYMENYEGASTSSAFNQLGAPDQPQLISQLGLFLSMSEDIQCRYSLAQTQLDALLSSLTASQSAGDHTRYYLQKQQKKCDEDEKIIRIYNDCLQLQLQLNLVQRAIDRLQRGLGLCMPEKSTSEVFQVEAHLKKTSTDKLRFLLECLLETLISMTNSSPSIPQLPVSMYTSLSSQTCELLFQHLCISGTRRIQILAGVLLVRVCGTQPWWGEFLGNILLNFFHSEHTKVFPQDRVFVLLTALGQKSLMGPMAVNILESLLALLMKTVSPLMPLQPGYVDLTLIGWILLFLCRNLDNTSSNNGFNDDTDKGAKKEKDTGPYLPNRWSFLQGDNTGQPTRSKGKQSMKSYRRCLQKRLFHHKQKLQDLEQAKKKFFASQIDKSSQGIATEAQALIKQQEQQFKKELSQYASKHLKDIMQIRRTDGEFLRKLPRDDVSVTTKDSGDLDPDSSLILPRERCLPVVQGIVTLILSMDSTCSVDLFLVACKVLAKICLATRPAISLSEAMTQDQLQQLILLATNQDFNHGNISWGGPWAGHAITCLLQDLLDGERLYPASSSFEGVTDDEMSAAMSETIDSLSGTMPIPSFDAVSESNDLVHESESSQGKENLAKSTLVMDLLLDDNEYDEETTAKFHEYISGVSIKDPAGLVDCEEGPIQVVCVQSVDGIDVPEINTLTSSLHPDEKKQKLKQWKSKVVDYGKAVVGPQGLSTALDVRLELGLQMQAELRLRVMLSLQTEAVQSSFNARLPISPPIVHSLKLSQSLEDELTDSSFQANLNQVTSAEMLQQCYDCLTNQLISQQVNLDTLLQLWLTLNEDNNHDESNPVSFDPSKSPLISLSSVSVNTLLLALSYIPNVPIRTWVLVFQTLTLLCNQKMLHCTTTGDRPMATVILSNSNFMNVLIRFLSGATNSGPAASSLRYPQVGPSATKAFYEFLQRLQVKSPDDSLQTLKEMMLKLVYMLTADRGAFYSCLGPLDAQCRFMDFVLDLTYENVDVSNAISVVESISALVYQHILCEERVVCRKAGDDAVNPRSCFGGLFASLLRGVDANSNTGDASRDSFMCSLMKLVNILVKIRVPSRYARHQNQSAGIPFAQRSPPFSAPVSDLTKLSHVQTSTSVRCMSRSDDEKGQQTDEEKTGRQSQTPEESGTYLADIIVGYQQIMLNLIHTLSYCSSSPMASLVCSGTNATSSDLYDTFGMGDPLSVGDGVYQILLTLTKKCSDIKLVLESLFVYLSGGNRQFLRCGNICRLSDPLLWLILKVLNSGQAVNAFVEMGAVRVICNNLVCSSQKIVNTSPSLISTMMQNLNSSKASGAQRFSSSDNSDFLQNFAPHGTITSGSPTASPAEVLIQSSPPHRRARSAAWSYHFYPDEAWVDLTIQLPFAILLKEVQISPHSTSLSTCPTYVSLEVSHDGVTVTPMCAPLMTCSLGFIRLQLVKPEVVTLVTIRLHRARDSMTIGLSQILLMGHSAFSDTHQKSTSVLLPPEDVVSKTSLGWVQLLQHCLTVLDSVAMAAASIPNLLTTCTALLVSPQAQTHCSHLETVLLRLGLYTTGMGLTLIDNILRNTAYLTEQDAGVLYMGKVSGVANESTIEILYQLGTVQDAGTAARVQALTQWLGDSARVALQKTAVPTSGEVSHSGAHNSSFYTLPNPAAAHVHCIAAILWQSQDLPVQHKLKTIITKDLLSSIYEWSTVLQHDSLLKRAVDCVLCAMCYIHPTYFTLILEWMGILTNVVNMTASISDDRKDGTHYRQQTSLTDDSKKANHAQFGVLTQTMFDCDIAAITLQEFGHMMLEHSHLSTLAITCRSPDAIQQLLDSRFPSLLAQGLFEFCNREISRFAESLTNPESLTDASKSQNEPGTSTEQSSQRDSIESHHSDKGLSVNADLVAAVLGFFAEISQEPLVKDWLGGPEGSIFWPVLLSLLCTIPVQTPSTNGSLHSKHKVMSGEERAAIETAVITFFTQVISCHSQNQHLFARVLCEVIREQGASKPGPIASGPPLSGFTRRLFLQVLLEEPKILVAFKTSSHHSRLEVQGCFNQIQHPRFGAGRHYYTVTVGLQATCQELINRMSDHTGHTAQFWDGSDEKKRSDDSKKEAADMGMKIEVVDFLSNAAGLLAKERREKSPSSSKSVAPRLPPRIKGRQSSDTVTVNLQFPVLSLYHLLLSGQALPADLTLSQLLVILQERGHPQGQAVMELLLKFHASKSPESKIDQADRTLKAAWFGQEDICAEDLLSTVSFPSALQVFASVGGLALLAEHLPVLYSEVSRQPAVPDTMNTAATEISQDQWVSVDSSDLNETFYEPVQQAPTLPSQSGGGTIHSGLPTIPPHSLIAFGLFLRLPGYAEVLLKERKKAQCLLRLVLGVTDDGDGGHILTSPIANSLPTLPFNVMKALFDATPLTTDDGVLLRRMTLDIGALHLILACLSVLSHHAPRAGPQGIQQETQTMLAAMQANNQSLSTHPSEEKSQQYWAKGTGFGTGSTTSSWDADQALLRQKSEEEHVTCLLQVISSYINPGGVVPTEFDPSANNFSYHNLLPEVMPELLRQSCLVPAISSYLRNDSVLDMARHIPLYKSLLELLRGLAICPVLVPLLLPLDKVNDSDSSTSVGTLLEKMRGCVDTYANRLKSNKGNKTSSTSTTREEEEENEGLALLIPDIQETARIVQIATDWLKGSQIGELNAKDGSLLDKRDAFINKSLDEKYMSVMKSLQFDTFVMVSENEGYLKFSVSHHYESNVRASGCVSNPSRARRLAQEAVTLSTSLPLSASSSVFVRCDEDRLDIMKVLITGPADTPYANGCFEFDVYFPQDYPNSPPFINLETTGNHSIRFNPNLYNDGKVCLSVLNTWHGRPEEKWNSQTSSFLQVLVSIQSLILVSEPYFNEPGYERSRGTPSGTASSREYDANIRQATVKWAMLEQIKDPSPCFKEVIQNHFWMKRHEVLQQCGQWITEMESYSSDKRTGRHIAHSTLALKRHYNQLREEFSKMKPPAGMEDEEVNIPEETKEFPNSKSFSELEAEDTLVQGESNNTDITDPITALESLPFGPNSIDC